MSPYARLEIVLTLLIGAVVTVAVGWLLGWWAVLPGVFALALLSFYRDPPRKVPTGEDLLLAPADGRVMKIERDCRAGDGSELAIVIFLSVLDVHINRSPCAGSVSAIEYSAGRFLNALRAEATLRNENNVVTIAPHPPLPGPVRVRQIAGVLARRIVCTLKPGDDVSAGQRFGMIKLGSQTEVRVPEDARWELLVHEGDHVKAGRTILARLGQ